MVSRNITPPFRFVCLCADSSGIRPEVECHPLPALNFEMPATKRGIWQKCRLWNAQLADLSGPVLYLDLDLVVVGNLDPFFEYGNADDVILARNPTNPLERLGQTSVYRFPVGKLKPLLDKFSEDPATIADQYKFEQRFVTQNAPGGIKLFPRKWVNHFRRDCRRTFPLNYFLPPTIRRGARIVIFPGGPHIDRAAKGYYYNSLDYAEQHREPMAHIKAGLRGKRITNLFTHLRRYILPATWIDEHWRE